MVRSIRFNSQESVQVSTVQYVADRADMCTKNYYSPPGRVENDGN